MQQKSELEKEKKILEDLAMEKESALQKKIKTIGNYVHDSVTISDDEVGQQIPRRSKSADLILPRIIIH